MLQIRFNLPFRDPPLFLSQRNSRFFKICDFAALVASHPWKEAWVLVLCYVQRGFVSRWWAFLSCSCEGELKMFAVHLRPLLGLLGKHALDIVFLRVFSLFPLWLKFWHYIWSRDIRSRLTLVTILLIAWFPALPQNLIRSIYLFHHLPNDGLVQYIIT